MGTKPDDFSVWIFLQIFTFPEGKKSEGDNTLLVFNGRTQVEGALSKLFSVPGVHFHRRENEREEVEEMRLGVEARRLGLLMELGFVTCCLDLLLLFPSLGRERGN